MRRGQKEKEPDVCGALDGLAGQPPTSQSCGGREVWRPREKGKRTGTSAAVFSPLSRCSAASPHVLQNNCFSYVFYTHARYLVYYNKLKIATLMFGKITHECFIGMIAVCIYSIAIEQKDLLFSHFTLRPQYH